MRPNDRWIATVFIVLIALVIIGAVAGLTLFWQHTADVPVSQQMISHCDPTVADPPSVTLGSSGQVTFRCLSDSAFSVVGASINATPVMQGFRSPLTSMWVFNSGGGIVTGGCTSRTGAVLLQNNTMVTLAPANYNYCAEYLNVGSGGIHSVSIQWTT
jgi:hypothetical protein